MRVFSSKTLTRAISIMATILPTLRVSQSPVPPDGRLDGRNSQSRARLQSRWSISTDSFSHTGDTSRMWEQGWEGFGASTLTAFSSTFSSVEQDHSRRSSVIDRFVVATAPCAGKPGL